MFGVFAHVRMRFKVVSIKENVYWDGVKDCGEVFVRKADGKRKENLGAARGFIYAFRTVLSAFALDLVFYPVDTSSNYLT